MYWVLLCLSSGTDLKKSRHVLKSLSLCNKVLSYLISLSHFPSLSVSLSLSFPLSLSHPPPPPHPPPLSRVLGRVSNERPPFWPNIMFVWSTKSLLQLNTEQRKSLLGVFASTVPTNAYQHYQSAESARPVKLPRGCVISFHVKFVYTCKDRL